MFVLWDRLHGTFMAEHLMIRACLISRRFTTASIRCGSSAHTKDIAADVASEAKLPMARFPRPFATAPFTRVTHPPRATLVARTSPWRHEALRGAYTPQASGVTSPTCLIGGMLD